MDLRHISFLVNERVEVQLGLLYSCSLGPAGGTHHRDRLWDVLSITNENKTILEPLQVIKACSLYSLKRHLSSDDSVLLLGFLPALAVQVLL